MHQNNKVSVGVNVERFKEFLSKKRTAIEFERLHAGNRDTVKEVDLSISVVSDTKGTLDLYPIQNGTQTYPKEKRVHISSRLERNDWVFPMTHETLCKTVLSVLERCSKKHLGVNLTHVLKETYQVSVNNRIMVRPYVAVDRFGIANIVAEIKVDDSTLHLLKVRTNLSAKSNFVTQL